MTVEEMGIQEALDNGDAFIWYELETDETRWWYKP